MKDKDLELENFLQALRSEGPRAQQIQSWKKAVSAELRPKNNVVALKNHRWFELAVAILVGVVIGAAAFGRHGFSFSKEENFADNATVEFIVTKNE